MYSYMFTKYKYVYICWEAGRDLGLTAFFLLTCFSFPKRKTKDVKVIPITRIQQDLSCINPQSRVLNYCLNSKKQSSSWDQTWGHWNGNSGSYRHHFKYTARRRWRKENDWYYYGCINSTPVWKPFCSDRIWLLCVRLSWILSFHHPPP